MKWLQVAPLHGIFFFINKHFKEAAIHEWIQSVAHLPFSQSWQVLAQVVCGQKIYVIF